MKFLIRVRCDCYKDIEVEAESEDDAINEATREFNCDGGTGIFEETL